MNKSTDGQVQDNKNLGRRSLRNSLQGDEHKDKLDSSNKEDETEIHQLELMRLTALDQVPAQTQPQQPHQAQVGLIGFRRIIHDL